MNAQRIGQHPPSVEGPRYLLYVSDKLLYELQPHAPRSRVTRVPLSASRLQLTRTSGLLLPRSWRNRLPDPLTYYRQHVGRFGPPNADGLAFGFCPFHHDHRAALRINVLSRRGNWRCFGPCGKGDLVHFHMKLTGLSYADAVWDLIRDRP